MCILSPCPPPIRRFIACFGSAAPHVLYVSDAHILVHAADIAPGALSLDALVPDAAAPLGFYGCAPVGSCSRDCGDGSSHASHITEGHACAPPGRCSGPAGDSKPAAAGHSSSSWVFAKCVRCCAHLGLAETASEPGAVLPALHLPLTSPPLPALQAAPRSWGGPVRQCRLYKYALSASAAAAVGEQLPMDAPMHAPASFAASAPLPPGARPAGIFAHYSVDSLLASDLLMEVEVCLGCRPSPRNAVGQRAQALSPPPSSTLLMLSSANANLFASASILVTQSASIRCLCALE